MISYIIATFVLNAYTNKKKNHFFVDVAHILFSATEELVCDPPCTGNKVCQNYTGAPDCVCANGFSGEDNCTGIVHFRITIVIFFMIIKI